MDGSPFGSPLQPEAGMREAGEREDRDAETLCHGELPLPCPLQGCPPWGDTSACSGSSQPLPCPGLTLALGSWEGGKELITISSNAGSFAAVSVLSAA